MQLRFPSSVPSPKQGGGWDGRKQGSPSPSSSYREGKGSIRALRKSQKLSPSYPGL